ncbi:MAG: HisA/HisF-related TIM barrel protein [Gammaproteobacteria bacterium]
MLLIPAIEIKQGKCSPATAVRTHGQSNPIDSPVVAAQHWVGVGARRLHVVDVDSAQSGKSMNAAVIRGIVDTCPGVPVQVSGGMLSDTNVENYFEAGIEYVILGTKAASTPHYINNLCLEYPGHILVELDTRDGKVNTEGWSKLAGHAVLEVAEHFQREGVAGILYSDKQLGQAHDFKITPAFSLAQSLTIPIILANGLASMEDLQRLYKAGGSSLAGAVLFVPTLDFAKAQKFADTLPDQPSE